MVTTGENPQWLLVAWGKFEGAQHQQVELWILCIYVLRSSTYQELNNQVTYYPRCQALLFAIEKLNKGESLVDLLCERRHG